VFRLAPLIAVFLLCAGALAQNVPDPVDPGDGPTVELEFPMTPVGVVLDFYEALTGKRLIRDPTAAVGPELYIVVNGRIPRDEAIRIIEISLLMNGYALIPAEDGKVIKVLARVETPVPVRSRSFRSSTCCPTRSR
jgi:hypothetical protein